MAADPNLRDLHEATIAYYNMRPILKDMPHKVPREPAPDGPAEEALMISAMRDAMCGRRVLEIACGAGGSTRHIADCAEYILGTEITSNNLKIARETLKRPNIEFMQCDAFDLSCVEGNFNAGFVAGFFHICPSSRHKEFLDGLHKKLQPGSIVFIEASRPHSKDARSRLFSVEGHDDQYMTRQLSNGTEYVLVENEFDEKKLTSIFGPISKDLSVYIGNYLWWIRYEIL